jgi:hypothetical protein
MITVAAVGLGMTLAAGGAQAGSLGGNDIARIFPGQFEAKVKGYRVFFSGTKGGRLAGEAYGQQDSGRWYVSGSSLCVVFKKWTKGEAKCGAISQQAGWYVASGSDGEVLKFRRADVAQQ